MDEQNEMLWNLAYQPGVREGWLKALEHVMEFAKRRLEAAGDSLGETHQLVGMKALVDDLAVKVKEVHGG